MAVSLSKGGNVSLTKEAPGLSSVTIGLGWDARVTDGAAFDIDASVFICGENGKVRSDADFVFYNNAVGAGGAVRHLGDNRSGQGDGDDEQLRVDLKAVPEDVKKLVFAVTIHDAAARGQNFGQIGNAFIRVVNDADGKPITRYDMSEDHSVETAMIFGELYRHGGEWKFKAVGAGFSGGLGQLASSHGVNVG
ncbi:MAG: TerD family protein [Neomegalonema sp.]|nr:TerD family protein [Neomegalonema sp.]MDD2867773.1 TerD family protein [Neomegalonema sp.]